MKKLIVVALMLIIASSLYADRIEVGSQNVSLNFGVGTGSEIKASIYYGYFMMYGFSFGPQLAYGRAGDNNQTFISVRGEHNININNDAFIPFLAANLGYASADEDGAFARVDAGMKFFLAEDLVLSGSLIGEIASGEVFGSKDDNQTTNFGAEAGLHFFF